MRRIVGLLSALATAAVLTVVGGASASAATGTLYVSGIPYANPSGCHNGASVRIHVHNATKVTVRVHLLRDCKGPVVAKIRPGQARAVMGQSVHVG